MMLNELSKEITKPLIEKAAEFLGKLVNKPLNELSDLWTDNIRLYRFQNQVNIVLKAQKFLENKSISPQAVPLKTLASLLEYSSWEEDPSMQDKWVSLLANAANPSINHDNEQSYVEILNQLSPLQAKILELVYDNYLLKLVDDKQPVYYTKNDLTNTLSNIAVEIIDISIENLYRLNLLKPPFVPFAGPLPITHGRGRIAAQTTEVFQISILGNDFMKHCLFK